MYEDLAGFLKDAGSPIRFLSHRLVSCIDWIKGRLESLIKVVFVQAFEEYSGPLVVFYRWYMFSAAYKGFIFNQIQFHKNNFNYIFVAYRMVPPLVANWPNGNEVSSFASLKKQLSIFLFIRQKNHCYLTSYRVYMLLDTIS